MKISENIERIDNSMANSYAVKRDGHIILIDAGTKGTGKKIIEYFYQRKEKPDTVLITHYHMDHIGGLNQIVEEFSPRVFVPPEEVNIIRGAEKAPSANSFLSKMVSVMAKIDAVQGVESTDQLDLGWISVVDTRGHTLGSRSYFLEDEKAIFVGDALTNRRGNLTINSGFTLDMAAAEKSKERILAFKGSLVLPGHGDPLRI